MKLLDKCKYYYDDRTMEWTSLGHTIIIQQDMMQGRMLNETVEDVLEDTLQDYVHLITKENILEIE